MRPSAALIAKRHEILAAAHRHGARNVRVFVSSVTGEDRDGSDLDLLVDIADDTSLLDLARLQREIEAVAGVPVDLVTIEDLPARVRPRVLLDARPL